MNDRAVFQWSRQWKQLLQFVSLFGLCVVLIIGCNNQQQTSTPDASSSNADRVRIGTTLKPRTLDPADSYELAGLGLIYNLSDRLYTYQLGTTDLEPQLATELPEISEDGLTYTIPLREGVTFHDGTVFNAEAMQFSLQRFIENGGKPSFLLADLIETVEATAEYELTISLKQPFAAFPSLLAFPGACAVSPEAYQIGAGEFLPNTFVGTGRYQLTEFTSDTVRLDPYADYWGNQPANEGVDMQIYASNPANLFNAFRTGGVDVAYQSFDPNQIKSLREAASEGQWQAIASSGTAVNYLMLNTQAEAVENVEVRRAIAQMMDRTLLNERVLQGQSEPIYSLIPTSFAAYEPSFQTEYGSADFAAAKQKLQDLGYSETNPVTLEIWHPSGSTIRSLVASTLSAIAQQELDGVLNIQPRTVESASFFSNISKGIYPAALIDWYPDFLDADNYIHPFLSCTEGSQDNGCQQGGANTQGSFYYNEQMNELIDQQRRSRDPEERKEIFAEIQTLLAEDVPYVPLWQTIDYAFAQNNIQGVTINPSQNFPYWTIEK
ncbi:extracellular solute-binding protein family 5 [Halothece sp. PCC 7418]|uniref:ABC transporter substrate-binding protein n=1 Tax=Halothece sp. (strain PCC 7418) TaxID=65093 RepID=UPI0002A072D0|nr:ABC transporter substrate-binding protein [Halothece sp. PCC 7418]AFZ43087.1 extracellular solute-binding protein family 5 [Halothece sp. PCC 7418]